jgi:hypothetical protein
MVLGNFPGLFRGDVFSVSAQALTGGIFGSSICFQEVPSLSQKARPAELVTAGLNLSVRPVPADARVRFEIGVPGPEEVTLSLYNLAGQQVSVIFTGQVENSLEVSHDLERFPPGIYLARLTTSSGTSKTSKVVIAR